MIKHPQSLAAAMGAVLLIGGPVTTRSYAAPPKPAVVELTPEGKSLESKYASIQATLKAEIEKALPKLDEAKIIAWRQAIQAEEAPAKEASNKAKALGELQGAEKALRDLEDKLKLAPSTVEDAKAELERARARGEEDPEKAKLLSSSESFLKAREKELDKLNKDIKVAKALVEKAKTELPAAIQAAKAAKEAELKATAATWQAMDALGTSAILSSSALDGKLARYMVLTKGTPSGLAAFAEKSPENAKLVEQLLADEALMIQMVVADGPSSFNSPSQKYGEAMKIYSDIQKASPKTKEGVFQRLAVATSISHAGGIQQRIRGGIYKGPDAPPPVYIHPVKRYLNYEKWYLAGELQSGFKDLSVWNLAYVVKSPDPDEVHVWIRDMVRTMRPDCIPTDSDTSQFVEFVDKEIKYGSDQVKEDRPENAFMQNILANGGICGRRGFFQTFMLQAFGVPAEERIEPGHSTLAHWHPDGWQTRLGAGWTRSTKVRMGGRANPYGSDGNFLDSGRARENEAEYMKVKRAQWIAAVAGEDYKPGLIMHPEKLAKPYFWGDVALHEQRRILSKMKPLIMHRKDLTAKVPVPGPISKPSVSADGVITIPAASCSSPTENQIFLYHGGYVDKIAFVKDNRSGVVRLNLSRYSKSTDEFEYTFDAPKGGKYQLSADAATPRWDQILPVSVNGGAPVEMPLPYTIGLLRKSDPIVIELKAGRNVLKCHGPVKATFDKFTLKPVK